MTAVAVERAVRTRRLPMVGPMVRATMRDVDPKRQTRRVAKIPSWIVQEAPAVSRELTSLRAAIHCPYGQPGDRLRVLETWAVGKCADGFKPLELHPGTWLKDNGGLWYAADDAVPAHPISERGKWRAGRFMPAYLNTWASRITLEITGVRVERVQDISEADAIAEGLLAQEGRGRENGYYWEGIGYHGASSDRHGNPTFHVQNSVGRCACKLGGDTPAQCAFRELWDSINGKRGYGWTVNPRVFAISYTRAAA